MGRKSIPIFTKRPLKDWKVNADGTEKLLDKKHSSKLCLVFEL